MIRPGKTFNYTLVILVATALVAGCVPSPPQPVQIVEAPSPPRTVYVDVNAYWKLHPAAPRLAALERDLEYAQKNRPAVLPAAQSPEPPQPTDLATPEQLERPAVSGEIDIARADKAIEEDALLRKLAEPDVAGQAYERRMIELRRQYLKLERKPDDPDPTPLLAEADRAAAEMGSLERQRRELVRKLNQPLAYPRAEILKARQDLAALDIKLADLRRKNLERLESALEVKPAPTQRIPVEERRKAFEAREERRARQEADQSREAAALKEKVREMTVPPAQPMQDPAPISDEAEERARARIAHAISAAPKSRLPAVTSRPSTRLADLVRQRQELRNAIQEDLEAVAIAVAKERGERAVFARGTAPEGTAVLRERVRQYLVEGM